MFGKLNTLVAEVLSGRTQYGMMPTASARRGAAIARRRRERHPARQSGEEAHDAMLRIMQRTLYEMSSLWERDAGE